MLAFPWPSVSSGDSSKIAIDRVLVNDRAQPRDPKLLEDLIDSIERDGLQAPIVVRSRVGAGYDLISGYHRLMAYERLWEKHGPGSKISYNLIPAIIMSNDMTDDEVALWELVENAKRRHLSTKERASLGSRIQELRLKVWPVEQVSANVTNQTVSADGTNSKKSKGGPKADPWFTEWYGSVGMVKRTAHNLWERFKAETGQADVTPGSKEGAALQGQFRAWNMAEAGREKEAAAKRKTDDEQKTASKAREKRRDDAMIAINALVDHDGESTLWDLLRQMFPDCIIKVQPK